MHPAGQVLKQLIQVGRLCIPPAHSVNIRTPVWWNRLFNGPRRTTASSLRSVGFPVSLYIGTSLTKFRVHCL